MMPALVPKPTMAASAITAWRAAPAAQERGRIAEGAQARQAAAARPTPRLRPRWVMARYSNTERRARASWRATRMVPAGSSVMSSQKVRNASAVRAVSTPISASRNAGGQRAHRAGAPRTGEVRRPRRPAPAPRDTARATRKNPVSGSTPKVNPVSTGEGRPRRATCRAAASSAAGADRGKTHGLQRQAPDGAPPRSAQSSPPAATTDGPGERKQGDQTHAGFGRLPVGGGTRLGHGEFLEQGLGLGQARRDDLSSDLQQLEHPRIPHRVADAGALLAALDDASLPQRGQMLRRTARVEIESRLQFAHRLVAVAQQLEDAHPGRMAQALGRSRL